MRAGHPDRLMRMLSKKADNKKLFEFALKVLEKCNELHLLALLEHPAGATSWGENKVIAFAKKHEMFLTVCDQCMYGQKSKAGDPMRKRTCFLTNSQQISRKLELMCDGSHSHQQVQGDHCHQATIYPAIRLDFVKRWLLEHWENYMFDAEMYDVRTG